MKERTPEQLNTSVLADDTMPEFTLEDIMREFGGGAKNDRSLSDETIAFRPLRTESKTSEKLKPSAPPKRSEADTPLKVMPSPKVPEAPPETASQEQTETKKPERPIRPVAAPEQAPPEEPPRVHIESLPPLPTAKELLSKCRSMLGSTRLRLAAAGFFMVVNLVLMCYMQVVPQADRFITDSAASILSLLLFALCAAISFESIGQGIADLFRLRISLYTLYLLAMLLCIIDTLTHHSCYCAVAGLLAYCLFRSLVRQRLGMFLTLRTVCSFETPMGIYNIPDLLPNSVGLRRDAAKTDDFIAQLLQPDNAQQLFRIYATIALPLTLVIAILMAVTKHQTDFVRSWMLLLLSAIPCAAMSSYAHPFAWLAKRLSGIGGALCGWHSAIAFGGKHTIILRDGDLFPAAQISSNGMKLYSTCSAAEVISYALAALEAAENPLVPLFDSLLNSQYGRHTHAAAYRFYDNGGIGAEVADHVVLTGTLHFMQSMGVHMPEGTRVRQAVYVSIDGELAGVFAIKYKPSPSTRAGLRAILSNDNFSVILATRDFLITPELLAARYEIPTVGLTCPVYSERIRLSEAESGEVSTQGAMIAKDTFGAFAFTVSAGQRLRSASTSVAVVNLLVGILGILISSLLLVWNAGEIATPLHLAAFQILWAFVSSFISFVLLRF